MPNNVFYIADNKMYKLESAAPKEIKSQVLEDYRRRVIDNVKRNEWKSKGNGAIFTETATPEMSAESALKNIRVSITSITKSGDGIAYTLGIDDVCGIYTNDSSDIDGILISDSNYRYSYISQGESSYVVSASFAGESHIGIIADGQNGCEFLTEGTSRERWPVWSKKNPRRIIYSGCGLGLPARAIEQKEKLQSLPAMMLERLTNTIT